MACSRRADVPPSACNGKATPSPEVAARNAFREPWDELTGGAPRPRNWRMAIRHYSMAGVSNERISESVRIAFGREDVPDDAKFAFVCGILKNCAGAC